MLVPYGGGALSSMMRTVAGSASTLMGGIPKDVYLSVHNRLRRGCRIPVLSQHPLVVSTTPVPDKDAYIGNLSDEIAVANHRHFTTCSGPVHSSVSSLLTQASVRFGPGAGYQVRQMSSVVAWCFQSWWGMEICVTIKAAKVSVKSVDSPDLRHDYWSGWMEVQCDDKAVLLELEKSSYSLVDTLTGGVMRVYRDESTSDQQSSVPNLLIPHSLDQIPKLAFSSANVVSASRVEQELANRREKESSNRNFLLDKVLSSARSNRSNSGVVSLL
mmetsp:Transcript_294/g.534  ORF Transcript_294/g.534 Transcript_294/m.534 type:complete len:272 (+) Transcript_294:90-905(+)